MNVSMGIEDHKLLNLGACIAKLFHIGTFYGPASVLYMIPEKTQMDSKLTPISIIGAQARVATTITFS